MRIFSLFTTGIVSLASLIVINCGGGSSSDDGDDGGTNTNEPTAESFTLSGTFSPSESSDASLRLFSNSFDLAEGKNRTQCEDGQFYGIYCLSFSETPVAKEGNVDCSDEGSFSVEGLPTGEPIGCFVRLYASATSDDGSTVGSISLPAKNINGSTDTLQVNGEELTMAISVSADGTISGKVVGGEVAEVDTTDIEKELTADTITGVYEVICKDGAESIDKGICKCFLGEQFYEDAGYENQDECMGDAGGAGAKITVDVAIGLNLNVYAADFNKDVPIGDEESGDVIEAGTKMNAISVWAAPKNDEGQYVSQKGAGGEGITDLGGAITWDEAGKPQDAVAWATGKVKFPGSEGDVEVDIPAFPSDVNTATYGQWMTFLQTLTANAKTAGWECDRGPHELQNEGADASKNIDCVREAAEIASRGSDKLFPRFDLDPYCDQEGCATSSDSAHSGEGFENFYDANSFKIARLHVEGVDFDFPEDYTRSSDLTSVAPREDAGIGVNPEWRYLFEPLEYTSNGFSFRESDGDYRDYNCVEKEDMKFHDHDIVNAVCKPAEGEDHAHFQLRCPHRRELAIKFVKTSTADSYEMTFDQVDSISGQAELVKHGPNGDSVVEGFDAYGACKGLSRGGSTFQAKATKQ